MSAPELLADLLSRGVMLWREGERLRYRAPADVAAELPELLRAHKAELLAALDENPAAETVQAPRSAPAPGLGIPSEDDDRRRCTDCARLGPGGACLAAARGEILASRSYRPVLELLRRCEGYQPGPDDPGRRPGPERWPGLVSALGKQGGGQ